MKTRFFQKFRSRKALCLAGFAALVLVSGIAKEAPKKVPAATQRELWVPTEHLQSVLKKMPRAVMLTPEQYEALLRDSQLAVPNPEAEKELASPVQATIRDAKFSGTILTGGDVVTMTANYVVESFTDEWTEIPLSLPRASMASIEVDAVSALRVMPPPKKGRPSSPILVVKGKGKHAVKALFHIPVKRSPTGNSMIITSPGTAAASLDLAIPDGAELDSALPFVVADDQPNLAKFVLPAQSANEFEIRWIARNVAKIPDAAIFQNCQYLYSIDSTRVQADLGFVLNSNLTKLPNRFEIKMAEDVRVLSVEGSELLRWTRLSGGIIEVVLVAGERDVTDLRVLAEADVEIADTTNDVTIQLPIADVGGIHRASGTMALIGSDDVRVKNIETGSLTAPIPDDVEGVIANDPNYVASFRFPVAAGATEVTLSKIGEKFKAQMDTLIAMERESVQLTRTLNVIPDEGRTFEIDFELPDGEELLDVKAGGRPDFSWVRGEGNSIRFSWKAGLSVGAGDSLAITSRRDPDGWFALGEEAMELDFTSATVNGAEALSGYVAVRFDESFRVETATAEGLDPRDSRLAPGDGTLAWFRFLDFNLTVNASRRATEIEAVHTAYALPLASNLEIEGQVDLVIRYTPIGEVEIKFPAEVAPQVRFDCPLVSEKNLNEETGVWTLVFHDELIGSQRFRYRMSLPFEVEKVGEDSDQKRFEIALPVVKVPAAKRLRGDWVLEANTDTELTFEASGLDAVDSLRVPVIAGYQPRHRVIAAYRYRGDAWSLKLAGTRHAHEDLVSTVIDDLRLDTVVSTDGDERHQAMMNLRTTGEQFLEIGLPKDSVLWTLKVDAETVKPIRAAPGTIRVQLPAHENANARPISVKLIYQTPGRKWTGSGKEKLQPIRVADRIPVMRTKWFLHLPEGYDYQKFESNLGEEFEVVDRTLLGYAGDEFGRWSRSRSGPPSIVASVFAKEESAAMDEVVSISAPIDQAAPTGNERLEYYDAARDQTRATFMRQIAEGWEMPTPADEASNALGNGVTPTEVNNLRRDYMATVEALEKQSAEVAEIDKAVRDTSLAESGRAKDLEKLREKVSTIEELKKKEKVLGNQLATLARNSGVDLGRAVGSDGSGQWGETPKEGVDATQPSEGEALVTREYKIPPTFLTAGRSGVAGGGGAADPFADPVVAENESGSMRMGAKEVLEQAGISFPAGGIASFDPQTGTLVVRTTKDQVELVDAYTDVLGSSEVEPQSQSVRFGNSADFDSAELLNQVGNRTQQFFGQKAIDQLNPNWRKVPVLDQVPTIGRLFKSDEVVITENRIELAKMKINDLDLKGKTVEEALGLIREKTMDEGADAPPVGTHSATSRSKLVKFIYQEPKQVPPSGVDPSIKNKLDLKLSNVTVLEALDQISKASDTHFRVTPDGIAFAPKQVTLEPMQTIFIELPESEFQMPNGNGGVQPAHARYVLRDAGIKFPAGASAAYNPATGRLAVRNTRPNLEAIASHYAAFLNVEAREAHAANRAETFEREFLGGAADLKGFDLADIGRLPIDFVLPESGRSYSFTGLVAPESIEFRFVNWERQIRFAWIWILVGGLVFWFGAFKKLKKPIFVGLVGVVLLTFVPLVVSQSLLAVCNALLIGWLVAAAIWMVWRLSQFGETREVSA